MKIIKPSVELIKQEGRLEGMFKHIEKCGRTCYKSEDKITEYSSEEFIKQLLTNKHYAMLEHGTVYLTMTINDETRNKTVHFPWYYNNADANYSEVFAYVQWLFLQNKYSVVKVITDDTKNSSIMCITTNYRVIIEEGLSGIMNEFITEPTIHHEKRITLKFTTNIGVTREGNRHRVNSIAEESTRFCNYTKEKFGNEITFIIPSFFDNEENIKYIENHKNDEIIEYCEDMCEGENEWYALDYYLFALTSCEYSYINLILLGWTPQQAREVLPLATKSEVVYTAFAHDWRHWFDLRLFGTTGKPHPNMQQIAELASNVLMINNLWLDVYPDIGNYNETNSQG